MNTLYIADRNAQGTNSIEMKEAEEGIIFPMTETSEIIPVEDLI